MKDLGYKLFVLLFKNAWGNLFLMLSFFASGVVLAGENENIQLIAGFYTFFVLGFWMWAQHVGWHIKYNYSK